MARDLSTRADVPGASYQCVPGDDRLIIFTRNSHGVCLPVRAVVLGIIAAAGTGAKIRRHRVVNPGVATANRAGLIGGRNSYMWADIGPNGSGTGPGVSSVLCSDRPAWTQCTRLRRLSCDHARTLIRSRQSRIFLYVKVRRNSALLSAVISCGAGCRFGVTGKFL